MVTVLAIEKILETYSLEEILEFNEVTDADTLLFLVEQGFVHLPNPSPIDLD